MKWSKLVFPLLILPRSIRQAYHSQHLEPIRKRMNTKIAILGRGRMGREIQRCLAESDGDSTPARGDIHFEVTWRGEVPGEHTVLFRSADESLSFTHNVADRRVFALGALMAARWLVTQAPRLYSLQDLVVDAKH